MTKSAFDIIRRQKGEAFAKAIRDYHTGILEIPGIDAILRYAGSEAEPLLPYLTSLLAVNDDIPAAGDPFELLKKAGYDAFTADTLEKQNSIRSYFAKGELLCTFNDASRYRDYHIVHAIREGAHKLKREDFRGGEARQDEYGTSVISIQMLKRGGFISIKNRYNHAVEYCDNTFCSNPDGIIYGLTSALKAHFNVEFSGSAGELPDEYVLCGQRIFKYHTEQHDIRYGDQAYLKDGKLYPVDINGGDAQFDQFRFNNKTKKLEKIDDRVRDNFANDFNDYYGGRRGLAVKNGNLMLGDVVLIGAEASRIKSINLPELLLIDDDCLSDADAMIEFKAEALMYMGRHCFERAVALKELSVPSLTRMGTRCFYEASGLRKLDAPVLVTMGHYCFEEAVALTDVSMPLLTSMGADCFRYVVGLDKFYAPALQKTPEYLAKWLPQARITSFNVRRRPSFR